MPSRILLITPRFYGVENKIKLLLEKFGYQVVYIENKILKLDFHNPNSKLRLLRRIYFFIFSPHKKYIKQELKKIENVRFDILFSINAFVICPYLFRKLKKINPDLYSVLYLWDSFSLFNWEKEIKYFDRVLTFDKEDSKRYGLEYKPNFFANNNQMNNSGEKYDLFFVGKYNRSRFNLIEEIISSLEISGIKYFIKLWPAYKIFPHNSFIYSFLKYFNFKSNWVKDYLLNYEVIEGIFERDFLTQKCLPYVEVQNILQNSNVVLDLPFREQNGYSHRLIKALSSGKKVLTTDKNILKEKFYNPEQVMVLDSLNPVIDSRWIRERSVFPVDKFFTDLELSVWLKSIINVEST